MRALGPSVAAAVFLAASFVRADAEADRTALYKEGMALAEKGDWKEAAEKFRKVVEIRAAPKALFTLAQAEEHLGRLVAAKAAYEQAKSDSKAADAEVAKAATDALSSLTPRIAHLTIALGPNDQGARATIDGAAASASQATDVDPGRHRVHAETPGKRPFNRDVTITEGASETVNVVLEPFAVEPPPAMPVEEEKPSLVPPIALTSAGGLAFVAGLVLFATGHSAYDSAASRCAASCSQDDASAANAARGRVIAGDILMIGGGLTAAAGGVWIGVRANKGRAMASVAGSF